jgi:hypothetical protein
MDDVMKGLGAKGPVALVGYTFDGTWAWTLSMMNKIQVRIQPIVVCTGDPPRPVVVNTSSGTAGPEPREERRSPGEMECVRNVTFIPNSAG